MLLLHRLVLQVKWNASDKLTVSIHSIDSENNIFLLKINTNNHITRIRIRRDYSILKTTLNIVKVPEINRVSSDDFSVCSCLYQYL